MLKGNLKRWLLLSKELQSVAPKWHRATFGMDLGFSTRCSVDKQSLQLPWNPRTFDNRTIRKFPSSVFPTCSPCSSLSTCHVRTLCSVPDDVKENSSLDADDFTGEDDSWDERTKLLSKEELMALLADPQRAKLDQELSEANQQSRYLKQQLLERSKALVDFKRQLTVIGSEIQGLRGLTDVKIKLGVPEGSSKFFEKYAESNIDKVLTAFQWKLKKYIEKMDAVQSKEVTLTWKGMAKSVRVMGSFDGWSQGEDMSPEGTGSETQFSATLMLQPGSYEIKFLVDGQWRLVPEFPFAGEGNNLIVVN